MPRAITERLIGYSAGIHRETFDMQKAEITDDGGKPTVSVEKIEVTILTFFDPGSGHKVEIPLLDGDRQELARGLLGGIEIASQVPGRA